jgi:glycosyltransferase involved in cell wall biosynthesis
MLAREGGSSVVARGLGEALARRGYGVSYLHCDGTAAGGVEDGVLDASNATATALALDVDRALCGSIAGAQQVLAWHERRPFDLLHLHSLQVFGVPALLLRELRGVPYVVTLHGSDVLNEELMDSNRGVVEALLRRAAAVTAVSGHLADVAVAKLPALPRPRVIHNFLRQDFVARPPRPSSAGSAPRLLHISSLRPVKRPDLLLEAFGRLLRRCPGARLSLITTPSGAERGRELLRGFPARQAVRLACGPQEGRALQRLYEAADVFVLTSRFESFGLVLLEALTSGLPVVAPAVGGIPEVLGEDWPWLLPAAAGAEEFARAIAAAAGAEPPGRPLDFAARCRSVLARFACEPQVERYLEVFDQVLAGPADQRRPVAQVSRARARSSAR